MQPSESLDPFISRKCLVPTCREHDEFDQMIKTPLRIVPYHGGNIVGFPDFFCIGPQRTGSTWLHANLVRHPQILMHRDKETFFFSTIGEPSASRFRYPSLEDYLKSFSDTPGEWILKNYHALRRCGRFYSPQIRGESTASYCVLRDEVLEDLPALNPDLKIIMLLRDPVERAWSHAKKDLVRDTGKSATENEYLNFFARSDQMARADYSAILERWRAILKPGHILLAPSTRIESDPSGLISDVLRFLGVSLVNPASRRHLTSRQNSTSGGAIPPRLRSGLEEILERQILSFRDLSAQVGPAVIL